MRIDVAICTWNRSALLEQTLGSLLRLTVPAELNWSLLVVNNGSTDSTAEVIRRFESALPLRSVLESTPGLAHARNRAVTETSGDVLAFTDDDVIVSEDWLASMARAFCDDPAVAVVGGHIEAFFSEEPPPDLLRAFPELAMGFCSIDHGPEPKLLQANENVFGANMAFRRTALADLRFETNLGMRQNSPGQGEELELIARIRARGGHVKWCPSARVRHFVAPQRATRSYFSAYIKAKGRDAVLMGRRYPGPLLLGAPRPLWNDLARAHVKYLLSRYTPQHISAPRDQRSRYSWRGPAPKALATLLWLRERQFLRGAIEGYRALSPDARRV